jgi:hypothetical protein
VGLVEDAQGRGVPAAQVSLVQDGGRAGAPLDARAVWKQTGDLGVYTGPLPSARVAALRPGAVLRSTRSDSEGHFELAGVPAGRIVVAAEHPTSGHGESALMVTKDGQSVTVRLLPNPPAPVATPGDGGARGGTPPLPVVVRDARTRAPIRNAEVTFSGGMVHVRAPRYASVDLPVPSDARELQVELDLAATVAGRVLDARGDPVSGVKVEIGDASGTTDARGEFRVAGVRPGDVVARAKSPAGEGEIELRVLPGEQRHDVDLRLGGK